MNLPPKKTRIPKLPETTNLLDVQLENELLEPLFQVKVSGQTFTENDSLEIDECIIENSSLSDKAFPGLVISDSIMRQCDLGNCHARGGSIRRSIVTDTKMTGLRLTDGWLVHSELLNVRADFSQFVKTRIKNVIFDTCDLSDTTFEGATLENVCFKKCTLTRTSLLEATLKNVDLDGSVVEGLLVLNNQMKHLSVDIFQASVLLQNLTGIHVKE